ncbi:DUF4129 domain-containing protein [Arthrobacter sp. N199823]|uniref:DUF4129 domain-containing protein n=1 Tax=Arthrobacter sp. N199823 TaxID=2058895 RepID=UPI000CE48A87|nr:DUF4129 domain-containing protein [Arthrobacter sp. N199823]
MPFVKIFDVPVTPGADEARRWAEEELAKQSYQDAKPGWLRQIMDLLGRALQELLNNVGTAQGNIGLSVVIGLVIVAVLVIIFIVRPRLNRRKAVGKAVFAADVTLSAEQHRKLAKAAVNAGDLHTAINEQFRALARAGEERDLTARTPGRTAVEIAAELELAFPGFAAEIHHAADLFNAVRYGKVPPTQSMFEALLSTDTAVASATPLYADDFTAVPQ